MKHTNTWSGLDPEEDKIWEQLFDEYVPAMDTAETIGGEILRAMSRIIYRFYNDGDMVGVGYGNETVNGSDRYLSDMVPGYKSLDGINPWQEDEYESQMLDNHVTVFGYLQDNSSYVFQTKNTFDSREVSDEDYARAREDENDDWFDDEEDY